METRPVRPRAVTIIVIINSFGAILTAAFWLLIFSRLFAPGHPPAQLDKSALAATFGFMLGDLTWALLLLTVSAIGLWRMKFWGWLAGQLVNILWLYSMTVIWARDLYSGIVSPGAIHFTPFVPLAVWAGYALWTTRGRFK